MNLGLHAIDPAPNMAVFQAGVPKEKPLMVAEKIKSFDGTMLFVRLMLQDKPAPCILIVHGYAEHGGRYGHVMEALYARGFSVASMDLRGHGYSDGKRGYMAHFDDYVHDLSSVVKILKKKHHVKELALLGHSMGGLIACLYASRSEKELKALMLSAPLYAIALKVPLWKRALGRITSQLWPTLSMKSDISPNFLSHDPVMVKAHEDDPLNFETATARWFIEILRVTAKVEPILQHIHLPLLMQLATDDYIVDYEKAYRCFDSFASPNKKRIVYEGFYHEIYNELERMRCINELVEWCESTLMKGDVV